MAAAMADHWVVVKELMQAATMVDEKDGCSVSPMAEKSAVELAVELVVLWGLKRAAKSVVGRASSMGETEVAGKASEKDAM